MACADRYYEGKEFEGKYKDKRPGELSADLRVRRRAVDGRWRVRVRGLTPPSRLSWMSGTRLPVQTALGMAPNGPPSWLINMQRYGPPPSYPGLRIPGLNAPLPPGCGQLLSVAATVSGSGWGGPTPCARAR